MKKLFNLQNFIYLTVFATPLYLIKFKFFNVPMNILDCLMIITVFWWLLTKPDFKKIELFLLNFKYTIPIFLILIGVIISTIFNDNQLHNWGIIITWIILPLLFGFIIYLTAKKQIIVNNILQTIYYSTFSISLVAILYFVFDKTTYDHRLSAFYLSPNYLAMCLAPGLIIAFYNLKSSFKNHALSLSLSFNILATIILLSAIYLTYSYATWLAILGSFLLIFSTKKPFFLFKYFILFLLLLSIIIVSQFNNPKFQNLINPINNSSLISRVAIWKSAGKILSNNWLIGIGANNFQEKYLNYQKYFLPYPEWAVPQPHNLYLAFWLHCGLLGFVGFLWLIILWMKRQINIISHSPDQQQKKLASILLTIILYILIYGIADTPIWKNDLFLIFWIIIFAGIMLKKSSLNKSI